MVVVLIGTLSDLLQHMYTREVLWTRSELPLQKAY
jgi:hypothetical protein